MFIIEATLDKVFMNQHDTKCGASNQVGFEVSLKLLVGDELNSLGYVIDNAKILAVVDSVEIMTSCENTCNDILGRLVRLFEDEAVKLYRVDVSVKGNGPRNSKFTKVHHIKQL